MPPHLSAKNSCSLLSVSLRTFSISSAWLAAEACSSASLSARSLLFCIDIRNSSSILRFKGVIVTLRSSNRLLRQPPPLPRASSPPPHHRPPRPVVTGHESQNPYTKYLTNFPPNINILWWGCYCPPVQPPTAHCMRRAPVLLAALLLKQVSGGLPSSTRSISQGR